MIKKTFLERQYLKSSKNKVVFINNVVQVTYSLNIGFTDKSRTIIKVTGNQGIVLNQGKS